MDQPKPTQKFCETGIHQNEYEKYIELGVPGYPTRMDFCYKNGMGDHFKGGKKARKSKKSRKSKRKSKKQKKKTRKSRK